MLQGRGTTAGIKSIVASPASPPGCSAVSIICTGKTIWVLHCEQAGQCAQLALDPLGPCPPFLLAARQILVQHPLLLQQCRELGRATAEGKDILSCPPVSNLVNLYFLKRLHVKIKSR